MHGVPAYGKSEYTMCPDAIEMKPRARLQRTKIKISYQFLFLC